MYTSGPRHALMAADANPVTHARRQYASVSALSVVQGEVQNVVAAMRQNKHWQRSRRYKETDDEDKLLHGFLTLMDELAYAQNFEETVSPLKFITPFLDVISSVKTSGPITSVALSSTHKLLSWNLINESHKDVQAAIRQIAESVRHCRFEATNPESDEVVLAKILETLLATVACPAGKYLSDNCICEMIQNCFRISNQTTFTALLRRTAQRCLTDMVCVVFGRLREIQPAIVHSTLPSPQGVEVKDGIDGAGEEITKSRLQPYLRLPATRKKSIFGRANRTLSFGPVPSEQIRAQGKDDENKAGTRPSSAAQPATPSSVGLPPSDNPHVIIEAKRDNKKTVVETTNAGHTHANGSTDSHSDAGKTGTPQQPGVGEPPPSTPSTVTPTPELTVVMESRSGDVTESHVLAPSDKGGDHGQASATLSASDPAASSSTRKQSSGGSEVASELDYEVVVGNTVTSASAVVATRVAKDASHPPYSLKCMANTMSFIASLIEPKAANSDQTRALALNLMLAILESVGDIIGECPPLVSITQNQLAKYLYRGCLKDDIFLFSLSLRVVSDMYDTVRSHTKLQFQVFFSSVLLRIARSEALSLEQQEMAWDSIIQYCCKPFFAAELYTNYDCDLQCPDLFVILVTFLSKACFPTSGSLTDIHIRAADGLLAILHNIAVRCVRDESGKRKTIEHESIRHVRAASSEIRGMNFQEDVDHELLRKRKETKGHLHQGALQFNKDPKKGIAYLQSVHLLPDPLEAQAVAEFFRTTPSIDKKVMGEYLGKMKPFNLEVLKAFFESFNLHHLTIDEALRIVLDHFRLPGEAQQISRILEHFAAQYYSQNNEVFADADAVFVLSFSVIMLNTDLHNNQVKKKMSCDDFIRNNRGINNKEDLPRELLIQLYETIAHDEIKMSDDSTENQSLEGIEVSNSRWSALLRHAPSVDAFRIVTRSPHDMEMFKALWGPAIAAISVVFDSTDSITVLEKARAGFMDCARIAAFYSLDDIFDNLVISVCKYTAILSPIIDRSVIIFGNKIRAQIAAQTAFQITREYGDHLREGWRNILDYVLRAFKLGLLPRHLMEMDHAVEARRIPIPCTPPQNAPKQKQSTGIFGGFSLWGSAAPAEEDESDAADAEATRRATECIASCNIDEVLTEVRFIKADSLAYLVRALILAPSRTQAAPGAVDTGPDEESMIFCLELLVEITLRNKDRISLLWPMVHEHLHNLITTQQSHPLLVERAILGLIRICTRLVHQEDMSTKLIGALEVLLLPQPSITAALYPAMHGILNLIQSNTACIRRSHWQVVFSIIERCAGLEKAAGPAWAALEFLMVDKQFFSPVNFLPWSRAARAFGLSTVRGTKGSVDACDLLFNLFELLTSNLKLWGEMMRTPVSIEQLERQPKLPVQLPLSTLDQATSLIEAISKKRAQMKPQVELGSEDKAWIQFCLPFIELMTSLCRDPRTPVANYAVVCLQRALLHSNVDSLSPRVWKHCFEHVVFPLMTDTASRGSSSNSTNTNGKDKSAAAPASAKEGVHRRSSSAADDPGTAREETRLRVCALLSKAVLHRQTILLQLPDFHEVWVKVLGFLELYLRTSQGSEFLEEAVTESLKNIMMVLAASGAFVSQDETMCGEELWDLSFTVIDPFAPQVKEEVCLRLDRSLVPEGRYIERVDPATTATAAATTTTTTTTTTGVAEQNAGQPADGTPPQAEEAGAPAAPAARTTTPSLPPSSPSAVSTPAARADDTVPKPASPATRTVTTPKSTISISTPPQSPSMSAAPATPTTPKSGEEPPVRTGSPASGRPHVV